MKKKTIGAMGICVAVLLLAVGLFTKVPSREISLYSFMDDGYKEYVGGDAYNIQIEASIRGGEIAGAKAAKAIYFSAAAVVLVFSVSLIADAEKKQQGQEDPVTPEETPAEKESVVASGEMCPKCGWGNPKDSEFCLHCGERLHREPEETNESPDRENPQEEDS